jgi:hypothetical protein
MSYPDNVFALTVRAVRCKKQPSQGERIMNSMAWIGIIVWGLIVAGFGLLSAHPPGETPAGALQPQDVVFLVAGGLVTCLIGVTGLMGFMGWIPALRNEQSQA